MILSDFLLRQRVDKSNPHEIIPISFDMKAMLKERYYNIGNESRYLVQTCSLAKGSGIKLPEVHRVDKGINPDIKPEILVQKSHNSVERTKLGQGRESLRRDIKAPAQTQVQLPFKNENQINEQTVTKQK